MGWGSAWRRLCARGVVLYVISKTIALVDKALEKLERPWEKQKDDPLTEDELRANYCLHPLYAENRESIRRYIEEDCDLGFFKKEEWGAYFLEVYDAQNKANKRGWAYSRAIILRQGSESAGSREVVATIDRNYAWLGHDWFEKDGKPYFLFSEDYHGGYGVLDLQTGEKSVFRSTSGGFCWSRMKVSPSANHVAVCGCFWAAPYENYLYRIPDDPMQLPWEEVELTKFGDTCFRNMGEVTSRMEWDTDPEGGKDPCEESIKLTLSLDLEYLDLDLMMGDETETEEETLKDVKEKEGEINR